MNEVFVGDARLDIAKAKELASFMGGAWHDEQDAESDSEEKGADSSKTKKQQRQQQADSLATSGGFLARTLYRKNPRGDSGHGGIDSAHKSGGGFENGAGPSYHRQSPRDKRGCGRPVRRPANGKSPGRRDPAAVARMEAEAKLATETREEEGTDVTWRLPTNVDYYTDRAALLRELVKEMPADKRLSFQTRVANARTKEAVESVLHDYAPRLECLVLPHARSGEIDLQQVKKDTARERVLFDGKEVPKRDPSENPHAWHEELWATVEERIREGLLESESPVAGGGGSRDGSASAEGGGRGLGEVRSAMAVVDNARALANEEWNRARAFAATSEVFKAMSRTGAGGDTYFALVALFCTADKLVVPVACQESPIAVDFFLEDQHHQKKKGVSRKVGGAWKGSAPGGGRSSDGSSRSELGGGVHVRVTVPSTFDIYLRDGQAGVENSSSSGSNGQKKGISRSGSGSRHGGGGSGSVVRRASPGHGATDASRSLHLVRVRAVVEEDIWVVGSESRSSATSSPALSRKGSMSDSRRGGNNGRTADNDVPPAVRFLLEQGRESRKSSVASASALVGMETDGAAAALPSRANGHSEARGDMEAGRQAGGGSPSKAPRLMLTRTERRMRVALVPEPSVVGEMVRSFSRTLGVDVSGPEPPRVLGS